MNCPVHAKQMIPKRTRYGIRHDCPESDCSYRCWGGATSLPCDEETAILRRRCHEAFDRLWNNKAVFQKRKNAYYWLAQKLGIAINDCHFGMFDAERCRDALEAISLLDVRQLVWCEQCGRQFKGLEALEMHTRDKHTRNGVPV